MERFTAMVAARRAARAPRHAPAVEERKEEEEGDEDYMRIQLEEIVIVKDDAYDALAAATAAAHANGNGNGKCSSIHTTATASASMEKCSKTAEVARGGWSMKPMRATATQGALTTVARIVGFN